MKIVCTKSFTSGALPAGKDGKIAVGTEFDLSVNEAKALIKKGFFQAVQAQPGAAQPAAQAAED